jgi:hypothetical protein
VPLAAIAVRGDRLVVESCLARPRIYSNAMLLDLILCLADKIEECCGDHTPPPQPPAPQPPAPQPPAPQPPAPQPPAPQPPAPVLTLKVRSIDFLHRDAAGEAVITGLASPLADTPVEIGRLPNAIRIRFNRAVEQRPNDPHVPTTPGLNDPDDKRHNVLVVPESPLNNLPYVPGTLVLEKPDTVRFDLFPDSPYVRRGGWQKGRYFIRLRGNDDPAHQRPALVDASTAAPLDGEPIAPAGGVMSGDNAAGGDFTASFVVG